MVFNSYLFAGFAVVLFAVYFLNFGWRTKKLFLLLMSYVFYAAWNAPYLLLILLSTVVDFVSGYRIAKAISVRQKRFWLIISLIGNLGVLSYFKYGDFLLQGFVGLVSLVGITYEPAPWTILLPVGISFYTFQTLSYTIDIYRGRTRPTRSFLDFALFVTFFPQLVAGPIVRARFFLPQLIKPPVVTVERFGWGMTLVLVGLFEKVAIADGLMAPVVDRVFAVPGTLPSQTVILAALAFGVQIFCDFAGYSLIAIGIAMMMGFSLPENFRAPFSAIGMQDFWQRWHISMSSWFRDYLYAPLRGKNASFAYKLAAQLFTMTIIGLWHGAGVTFVLWGFLNGLVIVIEILLQNTIGGWRIWKTRLATMVFSLTTLVIAMLLVIVFRSQNFQQVRDMFASFVVPPQTDLYLSLTDKILVLVCSVTLFSIHRAMRGRRFEDMVRALPVWCRVAMGGGMVAMIGLMGGNGHDSFIYFQF
ncbi:MBOAT family O-acyltransferase [Ruegeria sp.]|uniref:MBOAT family O-acyltransferase n=1 Tax=Ruegeria sp. TaxID=1879320 RepID=UPI00231D23D6|nr:MBOAT family O-acyltransferase [Ruegeria sp.]MDA7964159.1 hypothetical protein [Ruegeria sp.]